MTAIRINARDNSRETEKLVALAESLGITLTNVESRSGAPALSTREAMRQLKQLRRERRVARWFLRPLRVVWWLFVWLCVLAVAWKIGAV